MAGKGMEAKFQTGPIPLPYIPLPILPSVRMVKSWKSHKRILPKPQQEFQPFFGWKMLRCNVLPSKWEPGL